MSTNTIALVTGGTDGIGREVVFRLVSRGTQVVLVGRNTDKAQQLIHELMATHPQANITFWAYDLSLIQQVDALIARVQNELPPLNILIHSAGVMLRNRTLTDEGLETVFAVQYVARYRLTYALAPHMADKGVIVNISAGGAINMDLDFDNLNGEKHYSGVNALQHESVANDMLTLDAVTQFPNLDIYCYGPWVVRTTLLRDMPLGLRLVSATFGRLMSISAGQAADDVLLLVNDRPTGGLYGRRGKQNQPKGFRIQSENRDRLRQITDTLIAKAVNR